MDAPLHTEEAQKRIESRFPNIQNSGYNITSPIDSGYNCIAWAAGCNDAWWEAAEGYYWPDDVPADQTIKALHLLYGAVGYEPCDNDAREDGFEKIAIYADQFGYTHAARQLSDGKWTSKLGDWEDLEHKSLGALEGHFYGKVAGILKRAIQ